MGDAGGHAALIMSARIGAPPPARSLAARYPLALVPVSICLLAGMYAGSLGLAPVLPAAIGLAAAVPLLRHRRYLAVLLFLSGLAATLGTCRYQSVSYRDGPDQVAHYAGCAGTVVGVVDGEPQAAGRGTSFTVQVETLTLKDATTAVAVHGRLIVYYAGQQDVTYGDLVSLTGSLALPTNPPGFDYRAYLAHLGIRVTQDYPVLSIQERGRGNALQVIAYWLRDAIKRAIDGMLPHDAAALLAGILLGAPTRSLGTLTAAFVAAGMIHIVATSGLKVALVAGVFSRCAATLPLRVRWLPPLIAVSAYALVSGATPSGLRAALMWMLGLAALQLGRQSYVWVSLSVVAAAMAFREPELLWDTGFQLSVAGTAGIVAFSGPLEHRLHRLPPVLRESIAVTLAAQFATVPITAAGFGQVSLVGPLANGLLLPLLGPIMGLGGLAAITAVASPAAGHLLAYLVFPLLMVFIDTVRLLSALPLAALATPALSVAFALGYYALVIALALRKPATHLPTLGRGTSFMRALKVVPPGLAAGCLVTAITIPIVLSRPPERPQLTIAGSGGSTVEFIQGSRQLSIIVDGGALPSPLKAMLGRHLPFWQRGLSAVFASRADASHLGGLAGLTSLYEVGTAFDTGTVFPSAAYASWRAELRDAGLKRYRARAGMRVDFGDGVVVDVLEPATLSVDDDPPPVAYRLAIGRLTALVLSREAIAAEPTQLAADGSCLDLLVLPAGADVDSAIAVARFLHPRIVVLPQTTASGSAPTAAQLRAALPGVRTWTAAEGSELTLRASDGSCSGG